MSSDRPPPLPPKPLSSPFFSFHDQTNRWTIPSSIPVGSFGGSSLFYRLNESIAEGFAKFPTGPGLTDPFWVYMLTWHIGLFLTLTLAKIGYEGKKEGYFGDDA